MSGFPVPVSVFFFMVVGGVLVLGGSALLGRRRRRLGDHHSERRRAHGGPADRSGRSGSSPPSSESEGKETAEALHRLRVWIESRESNEKSSSSARRRPPRPTPKLRALSSTVRLARRHRPALTGGASEAPIVRVLGPVRVEGAGRRMTSQQQALVAMLGLRGPLTRDQLIDGLWSGRAVSASRFANLLADVRAVIGRHRLVQHPDGRYDLVDVLVDLERFADLVERAGVMSQNSRHDPAAADGALDQLEQAIGLIEGPILQAGQRRFWCWIEDGYHRRYEIERLVVSAGLRASVLALAVHQPQRARWACERCLAGVPHDEQLVTALAGIHVVQGHQGAAADVVAGWEQAVRRLGLGEPSPGPRNRLVAGSTPARSSVGPPEAR